MSEKLRVELVAEVQKFQKGLKQAEKKLLQFDKQAGRGSKGFDKIGKSSANAVPAVNEFSRVIQDAPFGIQGVANNITQLTQSFGYLQKSTGSSKAALQAMLSTLTGPAGILLAVSAVTSLMVAFGDQLFKSKDKVKNLKEEQEKLNEALDNYVFGLEATKRASLRGTQAAQKELVTLRLLRSQAENTNLSYKERIEAVNELQRKYPKYLQNASKEQILNGELKGSYDLLSKSILKRARSTAAMNAIVKNSEQLLVIEDKLASANVKLAEKQKIVNQKQQQYNNSLGLGKDAQLTALRALERAQKGYSETEKEVNSLTGSIQNLELTNIDLEGKIETAISGRGQTGVAEKVGEKVTSAFSQISTQAKTALQPLTQIGTQISTSLGEGTAAIRGGSVEMINALTELSNGVSNIVSTNLIGAFSGIGEAIGTALSEGKNLGNELATALLSSVGSLLVQLGQLAISIGVGLKAIKAALTSLNPVAAIAAGVGLIALGSLFKGASKKIGGSIGGGSNTGFSTSTSTQTSSGGSFTSGFSGNGGGTVVFEIAGTKLVGVLSNTLRQNRNLGGTLKFD